jgi:hypothetical protein
MRLFTYVTRWDHGFAPNPFHGYCTLATCKPGIRKKAVEGNWILGTGSAQRGYAGKAIFLMRVSKITTFDAYWRDPAFFAKRPVINGSYKLRFGDNIYHRDTPDGPWIQADSRHSKDGAEPNEINLRRDTETTDRVLISDDFIYWGDKAPQIPPELARFHIGRQGYIYDFTEEEITAFLSWATSTNLRGRVGDPLEWEPRYARHWR